MTTLALAVAPPRERAGARVTYQVVVALVGSLLVAGLAQITIKLPFTPVPITGQTLGVLLVGASLGPGLGAVSLSLYLLEGAIGLPFFAGGGHGWSTLSWGAAAGATGGYLLGFVLAASVVGWLSQRGWDRSTRTSISAMLVGEVIIYAVGLPWLHHSLPLIVGHPVKLEFTLEQGLYPFVIGDTLKLLLAAAALPGAWRLLERVHKTR